MAYKIRLKIPKGRFTKKELKVRKAIAVMYASSPYLPKSKKDRYITKLFRGTD